MPTIDIHKQDLEELVGRKFTVAELEEAAQYFKGEVEYADGHNIKLEIKSTDRPDLWNVEGVARVLRAQFSKNQGIPKYKAKSPKMTINVSKKVKGIRPCIAAAVIRNIKIDNFNLKQLIQAQEKIAGTFGRKRREVAIGIFNIDKLTPPLLYTAEKPDKIKFEPLDGGKEMTMSEIIEIHPKGREFGHLVKPFAHYPIIIDSDNKVVSMPPIINSEHSGKVTTRSKNLLIEVTGLEMRYVETALNILAMSLADRGGTIEQVNISDAKGNTIVTPTFGVKEISVSKSLIDRTFGRHVSDPEIKSLLLKSRHDLDHIDKTSSGNAHVKYSSYRQDIMHPMDIVEDMLIAYGYNNIEPVYPIMSTQGELSQETDRNRRIRELMIGTGAQEIATFMLTNKNNLFEKMNLTEENIVEIMNPISSNWSTLRNWLTPSIIEFLSKNTKVDYPQRIFELGQVINLNKRSETGTVDEYKLAYAEAGSKVNFTRAKSILQSIVRATGKSPTFIARDYPSFIPGRSAEVKLGEKSIGIIGEIHPQVLNNWKIEVPVVCWEIKTI
jgi:phenylalanyl-tRNA synthetase beta chain